MPEPAARCHRLAVAAGLAGLLASALAVDPAALWPPVGGTAGVDATLDAKRAALSLSAAFALGLWLLAAAGRRAACAPAVAFDGIVGLFLGLGLASAAWAINPRAVAGETILVAAAAVVGLAARAMATSPRGAARLLAFAVGGALVAGGLDRLLGRARDLPPGAGKFGSILFVHDNLAALLVAPALAAAATFALLGRSSGAARARFALSAAALFGLLLLLKSRAGLLAALLGPLLFLAVAVVAKRVSTTRPATRFAVAGFATLGLSGSVLLPFHAAASAGLKEAFNRVVAATGADYGAAYMRPEIWRGAFRMFREHPFGGVGLGNFFYAFPAYDRDVHLAPHAHDQYLQTLAELGLPGLVLLCAILTVPLLAAARGAVSADAGAPDRGRAAAAGAGIAAWSIQAIFEPPLAFPFSAAFLFVLIGLALGPAAGRRPAWRPRAATRAGRVGLVAAAAAIVAVGTAVSLGPIRQAVLLRSGERAARAGRTDVAIARLEAAARAGLDHFAIERSLGGLLLARGAPAAAAAAFDRAVALAPNDWFLHRQRGIARLSAARPDEAIASFERTLALNPGDRQAELLRAQALLAAQRLDDAVVAFDRACLKDASATAAWIGLATARERRLARDGRADDLAGAIAALERAAATGATPEWVPTKIAALRARRGRSESADPPGRPRDE